MFHRGFRALVDFGLFGLHDLWLDLSSLGKCLCLVVNLFTFYELISQSDNPLKEILIVI